MFKFILLALLLFTLSYSSDVMNNPYKSNMGDINTQPIVLAKDEYVPYIPPEEREEEPQQEPTWTMTDVFNVYNPYFGVRYNTGLNSLNPSEKTWEPEKSQWVKELSGEDRIAISTANSESYAREVIARRDLYKESQERLNNANDWYIPLLGFFIKLLNPFVIIILFIIIIVIKKIKNKLKK